MKSYRGTVILAVIVLAVGGFALTEFKKSQTESETTATKDYIFRDLKAEDVVEWQAASKFSLKKENGVWQLTEPVADYADPEAVISFFRTVFAQNVESLDMEGAHDTGAQSENDAKYGFTTPLSRFEFTMANGEKHKLVFGSVQTYDRGYYLKKDDDPTIWVAGTSFDSALSKIAKDLRLKGLRGFEAGVLTRLVIRYGENQKTAVDIELMGEKGSRTWQVKGAPKIKLDSGQVAEYLEKLREFRAKDMSDDLKKHSITRPTLTVEATMDVPVAATTGGEPTTESHVVKLSVQIPKKGDAAYTASGNKGLYIANASAVSDLTQDLNYFRDKSYMFQYDQSQATKLKVVHNDGVLNFEKQALEWTLTTPQAATTGDAKTMKTANSPEIINLLSELRGLKAHSFAETPKNLGSKSKSFIEIYDAADKLVFEFSYKEPRAGADKNYYLAKTSLSDEYVDVSRSEVDALFAKKITEDVPVKEKK